MVALREEQGVSLDARRQYMRDLYGVNAYGKTNHEEVRRHIARLLRGNAERLQTTPNQWLIRLAEHSRTWLVEQYQTLVIATAKQFEQQGGHGFELLDLVQEGNIGLLLALDSAQPPCDMGQLVTLMKARIRGNILNAIRDRGSLVRVAAWVYEGAQKKRQVERRLTQDLGRVPELAEVAKVMGMTEKKLQELVSLDDRARTVRSICQTSEEEGGEDRVRCQSLYQQQAMRGEASAEHELFSASVLEKLLARRQWQVMRLLYGLDEEGYERSREEVAELLGINVWSVKTAERKAIARLQRRIGKP